MLLSGNISFNVTEVNGRAESGTASFELGRADMTCLQRSLDQI